MLIERLQLFRFRNLTEIEFIPDPRLNFFLGSNGQGKTSVLEALSLLASLRSFRETRAQNWIQDQTLTSELRASIVPSQETPDWRSHLKLSFERETLNSPVRKRLFINQKSIPSVASYLRQKFGNAELGLHSISFNPSDHDLIRGDPSERRAYLDRVLSSEQPEYLDLVLRYKKTLEQRNRVLKEGNSRFHSVLSDFTEALLDSGSRMIHARLAWLQDRSAAVPRLAAHIAPKQPPIGLKYHFRWKAPESTLPSENGDLTQIHFAGHTPLPSLEDLYRSMKASLRSLEHQEWRLGSSLVGPHRDDWFMEMDRNPLRTHGSQGEIRTALLALKLAEIESFRRVTGHRPILLLDDFSSELDLDRRRFLMDFLQTTDLQVFISSTESVGLPGKKFSVVSGVVTPA